MTLTPWMIATPAVPDAAALGRRRTTSRPAVGFDVRTADEDGVGEIEGKVIIVACRVTPRTADGPKVDWVTLFEKKTTFARPTAKVRDTSDEMVTLMWNGASTTWLPRLRLRPRDSRGDVVPDTADVKIIDDWNVPLDGRCGED